MSKFLSYLFSKPSKLLIALWVRLGFFIPDRFYLIVLYRLRVKKYLDLDNPKSFNEKIQWLKLYYRKPEFTMMVDKYAVKSYISEKIGNEFVIPLLGVWDKPEDIDFDSLPNQFVLKCNHTSGLGLIICKDKKRFDSNAAIMELNKGLRDDYFKKGREWPYKNVPRKIIAEEYKEDESGEELKDYKLYCFNGEPYFCQVDFGKGKGKTRSDFSRNIYDMNWNFINLQYSHPNDSSNIIAKPIKFDKMKELARVLSKGEPFMRVDFYNIGEHILFSEITFYPISGFGWFDPDEWDFKLGSMIQLPQKYI